MLDGVDKLLDATGKAIETVPEIYNDALKPTIQESGKTLSVIPRAINAALVPIRKWIAQQEYSLAETQKLLEQKLENVGQEKITTPNAYVAVPAIQAISYSMDSSELRNLYANLLAKAMNTDTKELVHPSFVEIIKQMSPLDATIFKIIYESELTPVIDLSLKMERGGINFGRYNITWIASYAYDEICISIDNLTRLGLIEIPYGDYYSEDNNYNQVRATTSYKLHKEELESMYKGSLHEEKKYVKKTSLAELFYKICILD